MNKLLFILTVAFFWIAWNGWQQEKEIKQLKIQLSEAPSKQNYQTSAVIKHFTEECNQKAVIGVFPTIVVDYDKVILKCFQATKIDEDGHGSSWKELEMNPTFALPLERKY